MSFLRRIIIITILLLGIYFGLWALRRHFDPNQIELDENSEDFLWVETSKYWLDRQACRRLSLCGLTHWHPDPAVKPWGDEWKVKRGEGILRSREEGRENNREKDPSEKGDDDDDDEGSSRRGKWKGDEKLLKEVPKYVMEHAPLIHLYSKEHFWPSDLREHLKHTTPYLNHSTLNLSHTSYSLYNLHDLNHDYDGNSLFLHSKSDVEERPEWLGSAYNIPTPYEDDDDDDDDGMRAIKSDGIDEANYVESESSFHRPGKIDLRRSHIPRVMMDSSTSSQPVTMFPRNHTLGGYSRAPSILVIVDKGSNIVDAYWFYFYSYNLGTTVFNIRFGNHVGDWEHSLIRFNHGVPESIFLSAHSGGLAYDWKAIEKGRGKGREGRPILYSAVGSHAIYATPGRHPYILPFGLLADVTDRGPLWDPSLNYLAYHYNTSITHDVDARSPGARSFSLADSSFLDVHLTANEEKDDIFQPAACNPRAPLGWWWYNGRWGDKFYELHDWRQWRFVGQYHYVNGPFGPRFKNLGRAKVCQSGSTCRIEKKLTEKRSWIGICDYFTSLEEKVFFFFWINAMVKEIYLI